MYKAVCCDQHFDSWSRMMDVLLPGPRRGCWIGSCCRRVMRNPAQCLGPFYHPLWQNLNESQFSLDKLTAKAEFRLGRSCWLITEIISKVFKVDSRLRNSVYFDVMLFHAFIPLHFRGWYFNVYNLLSHITYKTNTFTICVCYSHSNVFLIHFGSFASTFSTFSKLYVQLSEPFHGTSQLFLHVCKRQQLFFHHVSCTGQHVYMFFSRWQSTLEMFLICKSLFFIYFFVV